MADAELAAFPRLAHGLDLVYGPNDSVQLRGVTPPLRLTGELARRLLPLLDGSCPLPDILVKLNDWPAEEILLALEMLSARGLIESGPPSAPNPAGDQAVFYWSATTGPAGRGEGVLQELVRARIRLFGWGALAGALAEMLRTCGCKGLATEFWAPRPGVDAATPSVSLLPFPEPSELEQRIPGCAEADLVLLTLPRPAPTLTSAVNAACEGRPLSAMDHFLTTADRAMVVQVPVRGVRTLYSRIGDLFAWAALTGLGLTAGLAVVRPGFCSAPRMSNLEDHRILLLFRRSGTGRDGLLRRTASGQKPPVPLVPRGANTALMNSTGHRANILSTKYTRIATPATPARQGPLAVWSTRPRPSGQQRLMGGLVMPKGMLRWQRSVSICVGSGIAHNGQGSRWAGHRFP